MEDKASSSKNTCGTGESLSLLSIQEEKSCSMCKETAPQALDSSSYNSGEVRDELGIARGDPFEHLPDHLLVEVLIRLPVSCWVSASCVRKRWAALFRSEILWQTALMKHWPNVDGMRRWPGPIARGSHRRRFIALHTSKNLFRFEDQDGDIHELVGHVYLFLKEQLEVSAPMSYGLLHGTIIDQFLACGKKGNTAHDLASQIWLAVIDNLDESEHTFHLLMQIVEEWEVFLPYPYAKSHAVQWRLFERLFTDFRDCLSRFDYYSILMKAKHKVEFIPATWLGY